jgi:hypothetical protein
MSDSYKKSGYCEMEAHYAHQQERHMIPLIVKGPYRADGWLGLLTTNKIYIDFYKNRAFGEAYGKVIQEISRYRGKAVTGMSVTLSSHQTVGHTVDLKASTAVT